MEALELKNTVVVVSEAALLCGARVLETPCADFDAYQALPQAVRFQGQAYGRTGWNSDRGVAYFRTDARMARG